VQQSFPMPIRLSAFLFQDVGCELRLLSFAHLCLTDGEKYVFSRGPWRKAGYWTPVKVATFENLSCKPHWGCLLTLILLGRLIYIHPPINWGNITSSGQAIKHKNPSKKWGPKVEPSVPLESPRVQMRKDGRVAGDPGVVLVGVSCVLCPVSSAVPGYLSFCTLGSSDKRVESQRHMQRAGKRKYWKMIRKWPPVFGLRFSGFWCLIMSDVSL